MSSYDGMTADQILEKVVDDGRIDADEVRALEQKLEQDWVIDHGEVELLFRVNHRLGEAADGCSQWTTFLTDSVARVLVMDLDSPGEIDRAEGDWLGGLLDQFSCGNAAETSLLRSLSKTASKVEGRVSERVPG